MEITPSPNSTVKKSIGIVGYKNMLPFRQEFEKLAGHLFDVVTDHPKNINLLLRNKEIVAAPCSSICLNKYPEMKIFAPYGVAAHKKVLSVVALVPKSQPELLHHIKKRNLELAKLFVPFDHYETKSFHLLWSSIKKQCRAIKFSSPPKLVFTNQSETSVELLKILYFFWFGVPYQKTLETKSYQQPLELVIGDDALEAGLKQRYDILDLCSQWNTITSLPFVFAIWQSKGFQSKFARQHIETASKIAEKFMQSGADKYLDSMVDHEIHKSKLKEYWQLIYYTLGDKELNSLNLFLNFANCLNSYKHLEPYPILRPKLLVDNSLSL